MGRVIHAPVVEKVCRRLLPVGLSTLCGNGTETQEDEVIASGIENTDSQEPGIDKKYIEELIADRDAALAEVKHYEEQLAQRQEQLEDDRTSARKLGYEEGFNQASEKVLAEQAQEMASFRELMQSIVEEKGRLLRQAEDVAVEIGFAATLKIMGQAGADRSLVIAMVKCAMGQIARREKLLIRISPKDYRRLEKFRMQEKQGDEWVSEVEFKADESIELGGCIIENSAGALDARLELQVEELRKLLLDARSNN